MDESQCETQVRLWRERGILTVHIRYTSRLYFKKYAYKVTLSCDHADGRYTPASTCNQKFVQLRAWCKQHVTDHKLIRRYVGNINQNSTWHYFVYVPDTQHKDLVLQSWAQDVLEVHQPLNDSHAQLLDVRNITSVRATPLYGKYLHAVYFHYDRSNNMYAWLKAYAKSSPTCKLSGTRWWPILYSETMDDVGMIKLTWAEKINYVKTVVINTPNSQASDPTIT